MDSQLIGRFDSLGQSIGGPFDIAVNKSHDGELTMEDLFEVNGDSAFAFIGDGFICIATDSRFTDPNKDIIYGNTYDKIAMLSNNNVAFIQTGFRADADYVVKLLKSINKLYRFDNQKNMDINAYCSYLSSLYFSRYRQLLIYGSSIFAGFTRKKDETTGTEKMVPVINSVSIGGSFGYENIIAIGHSREFAIASLYAFIGNPIMINKNQPLRSEEDAVQISKSILNSISCREVSTGGQGQIKILRVDGTIRNEYFDLKSD